MKQLRSSFAKPLCLSMLLVLTASTLYARSSFRTSDEQVRHYLSIGIGAGEANNILSDSERKLTNMPGADAQLDFKYEVRKGGFFFNIGFGGQYTFTNQKWDDFTDEFILRDRQNEVHTYMYHYTDYKELQHTVLGHAGIQMGYFFVPEFYMALGVKGAYPVLSLWNTKTMLMTDGMYERFIQPFQDAPLYGFYPVEEYKRQGTLAASPVVVPSLELGTSFRLRPKVDLRIGAYVEYALPLSTKPVYSLTDYSKVDHNAQTKNHDNLYNNLMFHSVHTLTTASNVLQRMSVGVKFTVLFDVTGKPGCTTCDDDSGIPYNQSQRIRRTGSTHVSGAWW